jgi:hypothetical protein
MMQLSELIDELNLEVLTSASVPEAELHTGYAGDLLSEVMAHAPEGCIWVTVQVHANVIAVAMLRSMTAVIFAMDRTPEAAVIDKAGIEGITLLKSRSSVFELVGSLNRMGIRN